MYSEWIHKTHRAINRSHKCIYSECLTSGYKLGNYSVVDWVAGGWCESVRCICRCTVCICIKQEYSVRVVLSTPAVSKRQLWWRHAVLYSPVSTLLYTYYRLYCGVRVLYGCLFWTHHYPLFVERNWYEFSTGNHVLLTLNVNY